MVKVIITASGRYLGKDLKAVNCALGETIETKGWYAEELIRRGLAQAYIEPAAAETEAPAEEPQPEPQPAEKKPAKRSPRKSNPFIQG